MKSPQRPETHDKRPGMGTVEELWRYRLAQRVRGLRLIGGAFGTYYPEGWSQTELASRAKTHTQKISEIENGSGCSVDMLVKLSRALGVSVAFLIGEDKMPYQPHELVDQAYERVVSLASSLDFTLKHPEDVTIRDMRETMEMLGRARHDFIELAYKLKTPDPANPNVRAPYGYEFCDRMEKVTGYDLHD